MLRKLASHLPLKMGAYNTVYPFSDKKENVYSMFPKTRKFISQYQLKKLMLIRIYNLTKDSIEKQEGFGSKFKFLNRIFKYYEASKNNKQEKEQESQKQTFPDPLKESLKKGFFSFNQLVIIAFLAYLFWSPDKKGGDSGPKQGVKRIVTQNEMIALLSTGKYNSQLIILRQMVFSDSTLKKIYQTICLAKQSNKSDVPLACIITNLSQFLDKVEGIAHPYKVNFHYNAEDPSGKQINIDFGKIIFFALIAYIIYKVRAGMKGGSMGGMSDMMNMKKYQPIKPENIETVFKDVAGMHQAKQEITEFVDFLKNPDKYIEMGAKIPKGALLTGPPGTGKTLLARACSGEAGVPFFYVSGSEFVEKYVGLGANRVRSLFQSASKAAPSIIFIDEIDAIGKKRNSGPFSNEEKENTLNQLLVNMDGFDSKNKVIVMAATNLKDSLDPALLRPGRFDRSIEINLPNFEERSQILQVHLKKVKFSTKFSIQEMAKKISVLSPGFSGAELANICNQAAILAARSNKDEVQLPQFEKATERVIAGLQKRNLFSDSERQCLAYYECGKAVVAWFTEGADPIVKISIAPFSKQSKGYSHEIKDQMPLKTQSELLNKAIGYMAGRTAEKHFKGFITSNGDSDLKKAKRIITYMVAKLGMSPIIGRIGFPDIEYMRKPYSENTEEKIDQEINRIFIECQQKSQKLVVEKADLIQKLKQSVMEKETLNHSTLKQILGERPFQSNQNYEKFLKDETKKEKQQEEEATITPSAQ